MAVTDWRTINVDIYDAESSLNFDLSTLTPNVQPVSQSDIQSTTNQIRQGLRGGDAEGALRYALEQVPYGADEKGKVRRGLAEFIRIARTKNTREGLRNGNEANDCLTQKIVCRKCT